VNSLAIQYHGVLIGDMAQITNGKANDVQEWATFRAVSDFPFETLSMNSKKHETMLSKSS
jgi:hypothetical protein